jgi:hypothetical protein
LHPDVEFDMSESVVPDLRGVFRGKDAVRRWWAEWLAAWETVEFEYELLDAGDRLVVLIDQRRRGTLHRYRGVTREVRAGGHLQGRADRALEVLREPVGGARRRPLLKGV